MDNRELIPRLLAYYEEKGVSGQQVRSLLDHNYEGMYNYSVELVGTILTFAFQKIKMISIH